MKFYVKDDEGKEYVVEEKPEEAPVKAEVEPDKAETHDDEPSLSAEDIIALKKLALVADKLLEKVADNPAEPHDADPEEPVEAEKKEEIVDTDEDIDIPGKACDSKKSFGALAKKTTALDSNEEREIKIADAWAKR